MKTDKCLLISKKKKQADKGDFFLKTIPNNTQVSSLTALSATPTDTATRCTTVVTAHTQVTVTTGALASQHTSVIGYECEQLYFEPPYVFTVRFSIFQSTEFF
jgi:hypothetical protein